MRQAPVSSWTFWPRPDSDIFGEDVYSKSFLWKVDFPIVFGVILMFFLPPVRAWTGSNPFLILAGALPHICLALYLVHDGGLRRLSPQARETLSHLSNLIVTLSLPLSTPRALFVLWILYLLIVWVDGFGNPKSVFSLAVSTAAPWLVALAYANAPTAADKVTMAGITSGLAAVVYLLAAYMAGWSQQAADRKAEKARQRGRMDERARIGRNLHGTLGAALSDITLWHEVARSAGAAGAQAEPLARAQEHARAALMEFRALVAGIDGAPASMSGLAAEIRRQAGNLCEAAGILFDLKIGKEEPITQGDAYHIARIVIEAVANSVQHGRPRHVSVTLQASPLEVTIEDDGRGFDGAAARQGRGLRSITEHAEALGAALEMGTSHLGGARIRVAI